MTKTTIAQHIDMILQKRQPAISKITQSQNAIQSLTDSLTEMAELRNKFISNSSDTDSRGGGNIWQSLDLNPTLEALETAHHDLERLKERFNRKTLRIGVAGQARQGKSQLLQSLTGLSAREIPTSSGGFTTGARSLIYHHDSPETYAVVSFYSVADFLKEIIAPYYQQLGLGEAPATLEPFRKTTLPIKPSGGGEEVALLNQLQEYQTHLSDYEKLLGAEDRRIGREDILGYVSQHNLNPDGVEKYQSYRAVRLVQIYTRFPKTEVKAIALADLPGIDQIRAGEAERLIKTLAQDVDILLFVKLPPDTGDAWKQPDIRLYKLAQTALAPIDLKQCSFMVLNRHSDGKRDALCQTMQQEAQHHGIYTSEVVIANCMDANEAQEKVLLPVLEYMASHIETIDENYLLAKRAQLDKLRNDISQALQQIGDTLQQAGISKGAARQFSLIFKRFKATENELGTYVHELKQKRKDPDESLQAALNAALTAAKTDNALPTIDQLVADHVQEQDWRGIFGNKMHLMRNKLTSHFQALDDSLRQSVEDMKSRIVTILRDGGLAQLSPERTDSRFLKILLDKLDKDEFPELHQGFYDLVEFQLLFRGLFQHRLRDSLNDLYPDDTKFPLPGSSNEPISDMAPEVVLGELKKAIDSTLYEVENALSPLLSDPSMARHAIVEEFRDRIWKASDASEQWHIFLNERKEELWPEQFKWQELLAQANKKLAQLTLA